MRLALLLVSLPLLAAEVRIEAPRGAPAWVDLEAPPRLDASAAQVSFKGQAVPAKLDFRGSAVRVWWISLGTGVYDVALGTEGAAPEPAMIGAGDRITFGRRGRRGRLAVGLYAHPGALDIDDDGDLDLIVSCPDRPFNGTYLFRNEGSNEEPLYGRPVRLGPAAKDAVVADFNGDGRLDLVSSGGYFSDVKANLLDKRIAVELPRTYHVGRDDLWHPVDWDGDGAIDLLNGVSDWRDYGWDDAFSPSGEWLRGPLHGYVYFWRNEGTNEAPRFVEPVRLPLDQYGSPTPNPVDWDGDGRLDLVLGSFVDQIFLWKQEGAAPQPFDYRPELCMIQPRVVRWGSDARPSLLVGQEGGYVTLVRPDREPEYLEQLDPYVKSWSLARPAAFDWNGDGLLDLIVGNSAGYLQYFENVGSRERPAFADRGNLTAGGEAIRRIAGPNGSVQGPAERKWGYSNPSVADWDLDGLPDIVVNDIWGDVVWYRNVGGRAEPKLAPAQPVEVEWPEAPPKPPWVWWEPEPKQLVTQWRTTPKVVDWDRDGLPDLVMLDWRGYLALYRRDRCGEDLCLAPPERIFVQPNGRFLHLAAGWGGRSGRRKVEIVDWDADGDLDLLTDDDAGPVWYSNEGGESRTVMQPRGVIVEAGVAGHSPAPNAADWNGDGRLDLIVGGEDGMLYYFERGYVEGQSKE